MLAKSYKRVGGLEPPQREQSTSLILESGALKERGLTSPRKRAGELELHQVPDGGWQPPEGGLENLSFTKHRKGVWSLQVSQGGWGT